MRIKNSATLLTALLLLPACESNKADDVVLREPPAPEPAASQPAADPAASEKVAAAEQKRVFFRLPDDGAKVTETFQVAFGVEGLTVVKAGTDPDDTSKGHHHIVVDGKAIDKGTVVPMNETNIHYGGGQTETQLKLAPGPHTLTMQFADGAHRSYGPELSTTINVEVVAAPDGKAPRVFFIEPADGAKVKSPVKAKFGLEGYTIRKAGEDPKDQTSGHHHVVVDGEVVPTGAVVPKDETHIHYGGGQTEAELNLAPGKHTLTLQLADGAHRSYGASLSQTITVEVE